MLETLVPIIFWLAIGGGVAAIVLWVTWYLCTDM